MPSPYPIHTLSLAFEYLNGTAFQHLSPENVIDVAFWNSQNYSSWFWERDDCLLSAWWIKHTQWIAVMLEQNSSNNNQRREPTEAQEPTRNDDEHDHKTTTTTKTKITMGTATTTIKTTLTALQSGEHKQRNKGDNRIHPLCNEHNDEFGKDSQTNTTTSAM